MKYRIFSVLFCFLALAPLAHGEFSFQSGVIKGNGVNFRAEPDLDSRVISILNQGLQVVVMEEAQGWCKAQLADGRTGWIYRRFVQLLPLNSGKELTAYAKQFLGVPYVYGGDSIRGFDCSGYTKYIFSKIGINLPHRAKRQMEKGVVVSSKAELLPGDLVFFKTKGSGKVNHVGIYLGENQFIHASSGYGAVRISPLDSGYYLNCYVGARRLITDSVNDEETTS